MKKETLEAFAREAAKVKGRFFKRTPLSYEFYVSAPLEKPDFFAREGTPTGFNVSYTF